MFEFTQTKGKIQFYSIILLCFISPSLIAQLSDSKTTEFAFLPAVTYNSDLGLIGGGVTNWYNYKGDIFPFYSYVNMSGIISTKGLASFRLLYDKPFTFGKNIRTTSELFASRFFEDAYFGIANYSKVTDTPENLPLYYQFQSFTFGFRVDSRIPLLKTDNQKQLDANIIINFRYETPWDNGNDRLISIEQPLGYRGGRTSMLGFGFVWEARNSEFQPTSGNFIDSRIEVGETIWGSSYDMIVIENDLRQYLSFNLINEIIFATRLFSRFSSGDVPYWNLSYAGDEETLRGYESRRFSDDNVLFLNSEFRTWFHSFPNSEARLGGTLFMDAGRTFSNSDSFEIIKNDLKTTFGFGALASFFTQDFIIRGDFGFSEEGMRIYFTTGFMF